MNDDERAAREWLRNKADYSQHPHAETCATILRLLDRPVLPRGDDVPDEVLGRMANAIFGRAHLNNGDAMRAATDVLRAHLTAPPPAKKVEAWAAVNASGDILAFSDGPDAAALICEGARIVRLVEAADE